MKPKLLLGLALVLGSVLTGCETEDVGEFHGTVTNLNADGRGEILQKKSSARYGADFKNGWERMAFSLNDQCQLVLFCPTNKLNQILQAQIESQQVFAWLVRTQYAGIDRSLFESAQPPSALMFPNSERLHGKVEVGQYDWRHKNLFHVGVDLAGADGTVLKCEFNSYEKSKFDANQLWLGPYLLIFGWPNDSGPKPKKIVKSDWMDEKVTLYRATGDVLQLNGKKAIYTAQYFPGTENTPVIVFADPQTGRAWAGIDDNKTFYFETRTGIIAGLPESSFSESGDGEMTGGDAEILWRFSPIPDVKPGDNADVAAKIFEKSVGLRGLEKDERYVKEPKERTMLLGLVSGNKRIGLNPLLFSEEKQGSHFVMDGIGTDDGQLRLVLSSASGIHKASVWIDMNKLQVAKVIQK